MIKFTIPNSHKNTKHLVKSSIVYAIDFISTFLAEIRCDLAAHQPFKILFPSQCRKRHVKSKPEVN